MIIKEIKYYTGVGSRNTPDDILSIMSNVAVYLEKHGYILRSGGADGADTAFASNVTNKDIYTANQATTASMTIASYYHPSWNRCSDYAKKLHGRNAFQVLGYDLQTPSEFVICWTPDGCINHSTRKQSTGGTGTAISIASERRIPVYNLYNKIHYDMILNWINSLF